MEDHQQQTQPRRHTYIRMIPKLVLVILLFGSAIQDFFSTKNFLSTTDQSSERDLSKTNNDENMQDTEAKLTSQIIRSLGFGRQSIVVEPKNTEKKELQQLARALYVLNGTHLNSTQEFVARDKNGTLGYIADPYLLKKSVQKFLAQRGMLYNRSPREKYFEVLQNYEADYPEVIPANVLNVHETCKLPYGKGVEGPDGAQIYTKKIKLPVEPKKSPKLLCLMYSHKGSRHNTRAAALTWGIKCDGFLIFSTETIPSLAMVDLLHKGPEEYGNMWQKVRSIWGYVGKHYLNDFDYFHIGGDDMYLIPENMKHFLNRMDRENQNLDKPLYTGEIYMMNKRHYAIGGPGYTLNRAAVAWFVQEGLVKCKPDEPSPAEDRLMSQCLHYWNIANVTDSRDPVTHEQLYHLSDAKFIYRRKGHHFEQMNNYNRYYVNITGTASTKVGLKAGLEAASEMSVAFHYVRGPKDMARTTALIYRLCPNGTSLGDTMQ